MAKKKKKTTRSRARKSSEAPELKTGSVFWRQIAAVIMIVIGLFILIGGFGWGGLLPIKLYEISSWFLGLVAFLVPFVLIFLAIHKIRHEENLTPLSKLLSSLLFLAMLAGMLHVVIDADEASEAAAKGTYGGQVGYLGSKLFLMFLNQTTAFIVFFVLAWIAFMFMFGIGPRRMLAGIKALFIREKREGGDLADLKEKENGFQLHEGVPVEHHNADEKPAPRLTTFKNSASKLSPEQDHAALTVASDPDWKFPGMNLLDKKQDKADPGDVESNAEIIKESLSNFSINVEMEGANVGPRVTQYMLKPATGVKMNKIANLADNIAYDLAATSIRIEAPIPGKRSVGIEVPNIKAATVTLASIFNAKDWSDAASPLSFAIGKDIAGKPVIAALDKMPHLLIAGQTGSGKSVMINTLLTSLLYRNSPAELKLIMVDPKQVELTHYNDIPHLLTPVITEPEKTISALKWAVAEMERRLKTFSEFKKRNIGEYNALSEQENMPYIVIVIDELADLMMVAARDVEALIVRIAQKARAAGIHLVLATQSPRVTVITGLIKANVPARIAFTVSQEVESRIILDQSGAEKLLGMGDMLFSKTDLPKPKRVQAAFISEPETSKVTDFLRAQRGPTYDDEVVSMPVQLNGRGGIVVEHTGGAESSDDMWRDAVRVVVDNQKASTSLLQRRLSIGYGRASRMIDEMEEQGIIGPANGSKPRTVLVRSMDEVFGGGETSEGADSPTHIEVTDPRDEYLTR
jgi:DNA segregation ATPase FtsK/SpoIIIE, S-DNA-T family